MKRGAGIGTVIAAVAGAAALVVAPGCAHEEPAVKVQPSVVSGGSGPAGVSNDVDSAVTQPRLDTAEPGQSDQELKLPRTPEPGTGGSGQDPGQPPSPIIDQPIPDTSTQGPVTPHSQQQLNGDRGSNLGGNADVPGGATGDQKQE